MMTIKDENDEILLQKRMQETIKAIIVDLLQEKLEALDASDDCRSITKSEHSDELFDFLYKTSNDTCRDCAH